MVVFLAHALTLKNRYDPPIKYQEVCWSEGTKKYETVSGLTKFAVAGGGSGDTTGKWF